MKNARKFAAAAMALLMVSVCAPMSVFADTTITQENIDPQTGKATGTLTATLDFQKSYTVTIPSTVSIDGGTAKITASNVILSPGEKINVTIDGNNTNEGATTFNAKNEAGDSTVQYTIKNGTADVADGGTAMTFEGNGEQTLEFTKTSEPTYAGAHTETLTFGITVVENIVDLSTLTADYQANNGDVLTGTLGTNVKVSIADGATVTLKDANITALGNGCDWAGINCPGDAILVLKGTNTICGGIDSLGYNSLPGIWIAPDKTLTIDGDGSLNASSVYGAGIGSAHNGGVSKVSCGNIVIDGGTITATGGAQSAGIGSGCKNSCGTITINGGTITATGGEMAAGIGSGYFNANCDDITINGGTITATGGDGAAGIGSGFRASCGTITITDAVTKVTATKGADDVPCSIGKGGSNATCGTVTIGGTVYENGIADDKFTYQPAQP